MKKTATLILGLILLALPSIASAQPTAFTGTYTADLGCVPVANAKVDAKLPSWLRRAATVTPAGTHPVCPFTLAYDQIVSNGVPTGAGPQEETMLVVDLDLAPGATCNNPFFPLPPPPYAAIIRMHQTDATFVGFSIALFNYDARLGQALVTPNSFAMSTLDVFAPLNYLAAFANRVPVTNTTRLNYLSSRVNAPIFGTLNPAVKTWSTINWNINTTTAKSETASIQIVDGTVFNTGLNVVNTGINNNDLGWVRLEQVPFSSSIPVTCL